MTYGKFYQKLAVILYDADELDIDDVKPILDEALKDFPETTIIDYLSIYLSEEEINKVKQQIYSFYNWKDKWFGKDE